MTAPWAPAVAAGACVLAAVLLLAPVADARLARLVRAPARQLYFGRSRPWRDAERRGRRGPWGWRGRRGRREAAGGEVAALTAEMSVLLRAGLPAAGAWTALAPPRSPALRAAVTAAQHAAVRGGDVPGALRAATSSGAPAAVQAAVTGLAATWHVADRSGAPVADLLERYAAALLAQVDADDELAAALAGPRATARVLVCLPPAGLLLGTVIGADPVSVLWGTAAGRVSGAVGALAALTGWVWTRRLLAAARLGPP